MNTINKRKAHIFNIDNLLIRLPQKVWIIEKNNPSECLLRIPKEDYNLIKSGAYKDNELSMSFNGKTYWLSKEISEELSFSFREYTDPDIIQDLKVTHDLSPIEHLKNLNDDIYFISTKGTENRYGKYYTELIDKLKEEGIMVNQVYYLNQSYFSQSKDRNIKKICYVILSNLLDREIQNDKLGEGLDRDYSELYYYDTNYVTVNKLNSQINSFLKRLNGEDKIKCKLFLNLVGSNQLKPFTSTEVNLNKYIQTFEGFISKKKLKLESNSNNKVTCKCGWVWEIESDDNRPYWCHECGYDNKKGKYYKEDLKEWKKVNESYSINNDNKNELIKLFGDNLTSNFNKAKKLFDGAKIKYETSTIRDYGAAPSRRSIYISRGATHGRNILEIRFSEDITTMFYDNYTTKMVVRNKVVNIMEVIQFISKYLPELINNRVFKKINQEN
jgi:hypothetical protein